MSATYARIAVLGILVNGAAGESPWLLIIIPAVVLGSYLDNRFRSRTGRPLQRVGGLNFASWYWRAIALAMAGSGALYHLATAHDHWYWWFLPVAAWFGFAWVVVTRKPE